MKDKYGETIYCSRCRREIEDKNDLHVDYRGMVYCSRCYKNQEFVEYSKINNIVLGQRTSFVSVHDSGEAN
jgi:hypothetical protein